MRKLIVGSVNADTGKFEAYTEKEPKEKWVSMILASASIPGAFPPVDLDGKNLIDGGTYYDLELHSVIDRCMEIVDDEADIIVDVLHCSFITPNEYEEDGNALYNMMRGASMTHKNHQREAVLSFASLHPKVNLRYLIMPPFELSEKCM